MTRRCSHCSNNGHNSRTCPTTKGVKLFGVRLTDGIGASSGIMKKSASMGNLSHYYTANSGSPNGSSPSSDLLRDSTRVSDGGYASDDPAHTSCSSNCRGGDRKKGTPWTEEEHRLFLLGLQKLGKGDWRGIARNFVISRTPTQVASHAQKYFIRQTNSTRRKRRSSLFDMVPDMSIDPQPVPKEPLVMSEDENIKHLPTLGLSLDQDYIPEPEPEPMESTSEVTEAEETMQCKEFIPPFLPYSPLSFPFWPPMVEDKGSETSQHQVLKPRAIFSKKAMNVDELVGMSKLTLGSGVVEGIEPSPLSLKLIGSSSRQSAFRANQPVNRSDLGKRDGSAIPAV